MKAAELKAGDFSERMLIAVAAQYGLDSNEYEKASGTRKSDRKRATSRAAKATNIVAKTA